MPINESMCRAVITPWGAEVKRRLLERAAERNSPYTQDEIVYFLNENGFKINKSIFSSLLKGKGVS